MCAISIETIERANIETMKSGGGSKKSVSPDGINVSVKYEGGSYEVHITDEELREAYAKALKSFAK